MNWAGGAGRHDGVQMVHTFEEVRTRTPANPNEAAPEAIMPQAAWEALLRDVVQGLRPPYTPQALRQWLQATHPRPGPSAPRPHPAPPATTTPGRGGTRARAGQGHQGALRQEGTEGPQVRAGTHRDRAPEETPHGGRKPLKNQEGAGAGTKARRRRAPRQTQRPTARKG